MKLKSYFADSVESAMAKARSELGPEAMLVYSRSSSPEAAHLGSYEVVFGLAATGPSPPAATPNDAGALNVLAREMHDLRRHVSRLAEALIRSEAVPGSRAPGAGQLGSFNEELLAGDLEPEIVTEFAARLQSSADEMERDERAPGNGGLRGLARETLSGMFTVGGGIGRSRGAARIVALVGPPGAGKTTALVKLAASYSLKEHRPAQLLSVDMYRVGGAEQLRSFASILGVGFQAIETTGGLAQAIQEQRHKDLILIDTPGHTAADIDASFELAAFLKAEAGIEVHLTVPASMKRADLRKVCRQFDRFHPDKLLATKLDETTTPGTILNESIRTGRSISYLCAGQQIPEDLREATKEALLDLVLPVRAEEAAPVSFEQEAGTKALPWTSPRADQAAAA